jgi:hypothetical protein
MVQAGRDRHNATDVLIGEATADLSMEQIGGGYSRFEYGTDDDNEF